ncbi:hypothetical protein ABL78_3525 [Leptomonas seymouri]|uniref:Uncharacterized protein n=1 Tax=Leptomonas seymouri TaxID=5684 RepID=A0A0N1PC35_LEPSE|nr:hypothetical protein ABL78_3525 [Leptomonas seymouri]|eukprot:KPI87391.1 hypothetical protein ABL78_3525 [Leptomonas seymouri]
MSIWAISPTDGVENSASFVRNSIAWDQLLDNLDLQMSSDSSDNNADGLLKPYSSPFAEDLQNYSDNNFKLHPLTEEPREYTKQTKLVSAISEGDDVYARGDEHDSPANRKLPDNALAAFCPSSGLIAATKIRRTASGSSEPADMDQASKSCFLVNGAPHFITEERHDTKQNRAVLAPKKVAAEKTPGSAARQQLQAGSDALVPTTMIASNDASASTAWAYAPKPAADTPMSLQSPPKYEAVRVVSGNHGMASSPDFAASSPSSVKTSNVAYFAADGNMPMGALPVMPVPYTLSRAPMPVSAATFFTGNANVAGSAASAANSLVSCVYVDSNFCLHAAPGNGFALTSTTPSACPPPPPPQLTHESAETAAVLQGVFSMSGVSPMQYTAAYVADESMFQPSGPSMPVLQSSAGAWGGTKAWMFHDGRWIPLSV